jgi:cysteine dioxygenase
MPTVSWDQFLARIEAHKGPSIPVAELVRWLKDLQLPQDLIDAHTSWDPVNYVRNPIHRCSKLEALVLCWEDGQATVVHDHGPSCALAKVVKGDVKIENFRRADKGERPGHAKLEVIESLTLKPGDVCASEVGAIHSMGNEQGGRKRLITLNVYSPPLSKIQTFDLATGAIGEKTYPALLATL